MSKRKEVLECFYNEYCDEDERLVKDKCHQMEFITTLKYVDKYLKAGDKILEVGAGTGRYSLHYAEKGFNVTAIEFIEHNLDVLKSHVKDGMKIKAEQGDAVDLSRFDDNVFDVTLVLGPLYHLYSEDEQRKAISEAIRVTKSDGVIMIAYIPNDSVMINWALGENIIKGKSVEFDENFRFFNNENNIFATFYISEFKHMMNDFKVKYLHNVATDGFSACLKDKVNELTDEQFKEWVRYHLSVCEREDMCGVSAHMLYICEKE